MRPIFKFLGAATLLRLLGRGGRLSLWWDVPSSYSLEHASRYLDQLKAANITELSITVQDHGNREWHLDWSLSRLAEFIRLARGRGIRCGVMLWPHPYESWIADFAKYGGGLVDAGAQFLEFDVEENWARRDPRGYADHAAAADDLVAVGRSFRLPLEANTYPYGMHGSRHVIRQVDAVAVQAYSQADADEADRDAYGWGDRFGPGGMQDVGARKAREAGAKSLIMGLAAYDQFGPWEAPPGVEVTPELAMRTAYDAALTHTKRVRWWSAKWVVGYPGREPTSYALPFLRSL